MLPRRKVLEVTINQFIRDLMQDPALNENYPALDENFIKETLIQLLKQNNIEITQNWTDPNLMSLRELSNECLYNDNWQLMLLQDQQMNNDNGPLPEPPPILNSPLFAPSYNINPTSPANRETWDLTFLNDNKDDIHSPLTNLDSSTNATSSDNSIISPGTLASQQHGHKRKLAEPSLIPSTSAKNKQRLLKKQIVQLQLSMSSLEKENTRLQQANNQLLQQQKRYKLNEEILSKLTREYDSLKQNYHSLTTAHFELMLSLLQIMPLQATPIPNNNSGRTEQQPPSLSQMRMSMFAPSNYSQPAETNNPSKKSRFNPPNQR